MSYLQSQIDLDRRKREGLDDNFILQTTRQRRRPDGSLEEDSKPNISDESVIPEGAAGLIEIQRRGMIMYNKLLTMRDSTNPEFLYYLPFLHLPSSLDYPDYYDLIKKPICLQEIKTKLDRKQYTLLYDVRLDFNQLFVNAKRYNAPGSPIFLIAKQMHRVIKDMYSQATGQSFEESEEDEPPPPVYQSTSRATPTLFKPPPNAAGTMSKRGPTLKPWLTRKMVETTSCKDGKTGRNIADDFKSLPPKSSFPQYFATIKHPMSFDNVSAKCLKRAYLSVAEFVSDVELILKNAQTFNERSSRIWKDAETLRAHFHEVMKEVPPLFATPRKYNTARRRAEKEGGILPEKSNSKLRRQMSVSEPPEDDYEDEVSQMGTPDYEEQRESMEGMEQFPDMTGFYDDNGVWVPFDGVVDFDVSNTQEGEMEGTRGMDGGGVGIGGGENSGFIPNPFDTIGEDLNGGNEANGRDENNHDQGLQDLLAFGAALGRVGKSIDILPKEREVARLVRPQEIPAIDYFTVVIGTTIITLNNSSLRQHSFSVPPLTPKIDIFPTFTTDSDPLVKSESMALDSVPFIKYSIRPPEAKFESRSTEVDSISACSLEPVQGLTTFQFTISPANKPVEIYRLFISMN